MDITDTLCGRGDPLRFEGHLYHESLLLGVVFEAWFDEKALNGESGLFRRAVLGLALSKWNDDETSLGPPWKKRAS
jgi:hypothetical protein